METPTLSFPIWPLLQPRTEGLLASLVYLDSSATSITYFPYPETFNRHISHQWGLLRIVQVKLEEARQRLVAARRNLYLVGIDDSLDSFVKRTRFYETAVSSYRNTLLYLPPTTLGEVLALCSLSHVIQHSAGNHVSFDFSHFEIWRNAIVNHKHREAFDDLIRAVCPEPPLAGPDLCTLLTLVNDSHPLQPGYQEEPSTTPTPQGDHMENNVLGSNLDLDHTIYDLLAFNSLSGGQMVSENAQFTSTIALNLQNLRESSIIYNISHFLESCGELTLVLSSPSSRRVTIQPTQSERGNRIEPVYIQRLRDDDSLKDPRVQAIVSVIDSFINLGYVQSMNEARHYMLSLGNVCQQVTCCCNEKPNPR
ncbi:uncharacterized protein B0J16DRAFT_343935 [Fusarium flagelliforme]|uniref:uncharacterized protein n=1 Tax=Fusarium flagelliforme TaxID=2675880 RepID=UPI001E8E3431|nr:uncharacterized protein B0J16DRAFT_343935 [Fusarium flagelliforme]KAH7182599.1 hypothetical protein B0J16DRAFT_343935 [Fusarium flagelliforme]